MIEAYPPTLQTLPVGRTERPIVWERNNLLYLCDLTSNDYSEFEKMRRKMI